MLEPLGQWQRRVHRNKLMTLHLQTKLYLLENVVAEELEELATELEELEELEELALELVVELELAVELAVELTLELELELELADDDKEEEDDVVVETDEEEVELLEVVDDETDELDVDAAQAPVTDGTASGPFPMAISSVPQLSVLARRRF